MRTRADSPTKTCAEPGCGKPLRARGLCSTHYNQTHQPNRHRKVIVQCSECGKPIERDPSVRRWTTTYCSEPCRTWGLWGKGWSTPLPADHWARMYGATCEWRAPRIVDTRSCGWCGRIFTPKMSSSRFCRPSHQLKYKKAKRRGKVAGATGTYTWSEVARLWVAFNRACAYCRRPTPLSAVQAEHVVPLSRGGANNLTNLLPSCASCNSDKRDILLPDWNADRARRHLPPLATTWDSDDKRYLHLTSTPGTAHAA